MSDTKDLADDIRTLRILISLWKIQGMQTKMTLLLASGDMKAVGKLSDEITTLLKDAGERIDTSIDRLERAMNAKEAPDGGN
jgi:gas vesicle protein